jgi:hypothetical protein
MVSVANSAAAMAILSALVFDFMTLPLEVPYPVDRRSHTLFDLTPYLMVQTWCQATGAFATIFPRAAEF